MFVVFRIEWEITNDSSEFRYSHLANTSETCNCNELLHHLSYVLLTCKQTIKIPVKIRIKSKSFVVISVTLPTADVAAVVVQEGRNGRLQTRVTNCMFTQNIKRASNLYDFVINLSRRTDTHLFVQKRNVIISNCNRQYNSYV